MSIAKRIAQVESKLRDALEALHDGPDADILAEIDALQRNLIDLSDEATAKGR